MAHSHSLKKHKKDFTTAFVIGILLNISFVIAEIIYGISSNSLALLADAGHNASDVLGLILAWGATILAKKNSSERFTYGLQSSTIIASLANAILLITAVGGIAWEAIARLKDHQTTIDSEVVIWVAIFGVFINAVTAFLFMKESKNDLNIRGAFLHMAFDALISVGVAISGFIMLKTNWSMIDPIVSLIVAFTILVGTWKLLTDSVKLALHAVPENIDYNKVKDFLANWENVVKVQDLHIWAMSTSEVALSAHILMKKNPHPSFLKEVSKKLEDDFNIGHPTIQIEVQNVSQDL